MTSFLLIFGALNVISPIYMIFNLGDLTEIANLDQKQRNTLINMLKCGILMIFAGLVSFLA